MYKKVVIFEDRRVIKNKNDYKSVLIKAVIPVAGFGTRFLPASKIIPKEMFPIGDKPAVHIIVKEAFDSGA